MTECAFSSYLSTQPDTSQALEEACAAIRADLGDRQVSLVAVFVSPHHQAELDRIAASITARLQAQQLIGCTGEAIVGRQQEIEQSPALSIWAAHAPALVVRPFHLQFEQLPEKIAMHGWPEPAEVEGQPPVVLLMPEPFSSVPQMVLERFEAEYPGAVVIGGVASGAQKPGHNRLFLGDQSHEHGVVGMLLSGPIGVRALVSQGCRPIGKHLVITKASQNVIHELGGKAAFSQFQQIYQAMGEADQELARKALHIGCVVNEYQSEFQRGDFLVRNIMGIDQQGGSIAITDQVRVGQTVQFHVRDAGSATEDLQQMLAREQSASGALLFTCNGRGTRLFGDANHDASQIHSALGNIPLAGFLAQGEIGPIGEKSFLHGFTASIALFG